MNLGDTIYAWQVLDEVDGEWGLLSSMIPAFGISSPLVARSLDHVTCDEYLFTVGQHRRMYGYPIRLARFVLAAVISDEERTDERHQAHP